MNKTRRIIQLSNIENVKPYNILTFPTHERYESQLCKTGHNFYSMSIQNAKRWNVDQVSIPSNYFILPENQVCEYLNYDFILVQNRYWQYEIASRINNMLQIPIVVLEHSLPVDTKTQNIDTLRSMVGNVNVFISEFSQKSWGIEDAAMVIHHGIDSNVFCRLNDIPREKYVLTVANDFIRRNYCLHYDLWQEITSNMPNRVIGDTPGLSKSASSTQELVKEYNKCGVYFNTSTTPIPMSLLEAMSCGCAIVTVDASMMSNIIVNGVNGFITNDKNQMTHYINELLNNEDLRNRLGSNARKTIIDLFSEARFIDQWNLVFDNLYEVSTL